MVLPQLTWGEVMTRLATALLGIACGTFLLAHFVAAFLDHALAVSIGGVQ